MSVYAALRVTKSASIGQVESTYPCLRFTSKGGEMVLQEYEAWDYNAPLLPPLTRLYHVSPIGLGTPMVESLTGYIVRLAEAHCVSAGVLYWKEIRALADKGNIFTFRVSNTDGYSTHTINGLGAPATDFVRALEALTGNRDLSSLTLLKWAGVLPGHSLLRRCRAWCESCLYAWREANQPIYEPLLWALQAVTVCPYHRRILHQGCPRCERQIGPLDSRSRRDHCSRCEQTLIPTATNPTSDSRVLPGDELEWASWVASALGELLAAAPQITCPPGRDHLAQTIRVCVGKLCSRNASALARLMHVGRGAISRWQRGRSTPRLAHLLSMAYRLEISLLDLLLGCPTFATSRGFVRAVPVEANAGSQRPTTAYGRRVDRAEVSRTLHMALGETPPPSVEQVMRRLSHAGPTIYRHFPELCRQIARHYAEYRVKRAIARRVQAAEEVRRVAYELHAKGTGLTRRHIRPLLTSSDYLNLEEGRTALREVRRQLALQASSR